MPNNKIQWTICWCSYHLLLCVHFSGAAGQLAARLTHRRELLLLHGAATAHKNHAIPFPDTYWGTCPPARFPPLASRHVDSLVHAVADVHQGRACHVGKAAQVKELADFAKERFGRIDLW